MISFGFADIDASVIDIDYSHLRNWLKSVIDIENKILGEINYVFCSDEYLHKVNVDYLDHDTFTDIITFPSTEDANIISGDIIVSYDRILDNSRELEILSEIELKRVVVHGVLHLIGYDDTTDTLKLQMREKEDFHLARW